MKGSEFIAKLPEHSGSMRERFILEAFRSGFGVSPRWVDIETIVANHKVVFQVAEDALSIGTDDDFVRVAVTARTAQRIADHFGALLQTSRTSDLAWKAATVRLAPHTQGVDGMDLTSHFVAHHNAIEATRNGRDGLVSTVGKDWILSRRLLHFPDAAVTYGWHQPSGIAIQRRGPELAPPAHNLDHVDYSQLAPRLLHPVVVVDGEMRSTEAVLADEDLCALLSDEGPIPFSRLPGVPPS